MKVGVIGVGWGTLIHVPAFQSEGFEVVAIGASHLERAQAAADRFGVPHAFGDWRSLLEVDGLEAVSVATPCALHYPIVMAALKAGKHVLCEKAFGRNVDEATSMAAAARRAGRTAMVAHEFRFAPTRVLARELIASGYLGKLRLAVARVIKGSEVERPGGAEYNTYRDDASAGAGQLFGLGSHYVDCLLDWFGPPSSVAGDLVTIDPERHRDGNVVLADRDDLYSFTLRFPRGGLAQVLGTRLAPFGDDSRIELYGSEGALIMPQEHAFNAPASGRLFGGRIGDGELSEIDVPARLRPFVDVRDDRLVPFRLLVREFARGVTLGTSPSPNFDDGLACQQVLDAVRRAEATGSRTAL